MAKHISLRAATSVYRLRKEGVSIEQQLYLLIRDTIGSLFEV
jgi:hypothetical protein